MMRTTVVAIGCVLLAGAWSEGRAEVRAKISPAGEYVRTEIFMSMTSSGLLVWSPRRESQAIRASMLNPLGDMYGDDWPNIAEHSLAPHHPWVVWSRMDGADYDLVWSAWEPGGWKAVEWLTEDPADFGDDLDADLDFDTEGRPHLFWWRDEDGVGTVLFSLKLDDGWTYPYRVSDEGTDSRYPFLVGFPQNGGVLVEYETPQGPVTRLLLVNHPTSITEDIDPLITVTTVP